MNSLKNTGRLTLVALAVTACTLALAEEPGWYGGLNAGQSNATIDDANIRAGLLQRGFGTSSIKDEGQSTGYKLFGGYKFNKNFAVEGGYFDLGTFKYDATTVPAGNLRGQIKLSGINVDAVGILPFTDRFSAFARLGVHQTEAYDNFTGTGAINALNPNPIKRENNLKAGVGLEYAFSDHFSARTELERYRVNDAVGGRGDIDLVSVGLVWRVGKKTPEPAPRMAVAEPAPAPPVVAPPPPPPVVFMPPPPPPPVVRPAPRRVSLSADSLFTFDKSALTPDGRQALDKLGGELRGVQFDVVKVTGNTDRIGSHAYNMKLSTQRADAVSQYLVGTVGIPASKVQATGVNSSNPVTTAADCPGKKATKALIACLQPDRRVDIEVTGTQQP